MATLIRAPGVGALKSLQRLAVELSYVMLASRDNNSLKSAIELIPSAAEQERGTSVEMKANVPRLTYGRISADRLELRKDGVNGNICICCCRLH